MQKSTGVLANSGTVGCLQLANIASLLLNHWAQWQSDWAIPRIGPITPLIG